MQDAYWFVTNHLIILQNASLGGSYLNSSFHGHKAPGGRLYGHDEEIILLFILKRESLVDIQVDTRPHG